MKSVRKQIKHKHKQARQTESKLPCVCETELQSYRVSEKELAVRQKCIGSKPTAPDMKAFKHQSIKAEQK